ncbi:MAG: hypothetical protein LUH03_06045 [Oscillospiraceae bacterium]|nr:hypothetical protein [Oscillospiraceae bacterium]
MKKFVSIALAIVMMLSVSISVFAVDDDYINSVASEVLSEYTVLFPMDNGWWNEDADLSSSTDDGVAFVEAITTEGAKIIVKADAIAGSDEDGYGYQYGIQTNDSWQLYLAHFNYPDEEPSSDTTYLMAAEDVVVEGDYSYIIIDAAEFVALMAEHGDDITTCTWKWINGACSGAKTYGVYVITTAVAEETTEETTEEAEDASDATEETTESTETTTASSPDTGVALALVPMAIAGIAVVSSKRR